MSQIEWKQVSYWYPQMEEPILKDISFQVKEGEIVLLCGKSGCGKSTLLRQMNPSLVSGGTLTGNISIEGKLLETMSPMEAVKNIGYVGQNPEAQIVTDKVWHELAFGLESLSVPNVQMKRRVAEMAEFFGISGLFLKDTNALSGGQMQILNLASVMVMRPKILLLDEPTSQLDPIMAQRFIETLKRINEEFGVTIVISEQCLEQVLPMADRVLIMEEGKLVELTDTRVCGQMMWEKKNPVFQALPAAMKLHVETKSSGSAPLNVVEGVRWLKTKKLATFETLQKEERKNTDISLEAKGVSFGYEKKQKKVLEDFSVSFPVGKVSAILGGNGTGKTTILKVLSGIYKPERGKLKTKGRCVYMPQNPQLLFTEPTVCEELEEVFIGHSRQFGNLSDKEIEDRVIQMLEFMELNEVASNHPFDLSGGQQQRLALGKLLLLEPDILLLDEPTKGLDAAFKEKMGELFEKLKKSGKTIIMVSHDVDFSAEHADYCGLLFQGQIANLEPVNQFFCENYFYTTSVHRIFQRLDENSPVITCKQALEVIFSKTVPERNGEG